MLRRIFRYSPLLGVLMLLAFALVIYFMSQLGGCYFDFFSQTATVPYLTSTPVRGLFILILVGIIFGLGLVSAFLRR